MSLVYFFIKILDNYIKDSNKKWSKYNTIHYYLIILRVGFKVILREVLLSNKRIYTKNKLNMKKVL